MTIPIPSKIKAYGYYLRYLYLLKTSPLLKNQLQDPLTIPVIIVNYNQLHDLKQLIGFLISRQFKNIVILDNHSDYPPLLEYYRAIKDEVTVELLPENYGHMVFFERKELQHKYGKGFFILTDADIIPNPSLPEDFMDTLLKLIHTYFRNVTKVGFALDLNTIPDFYPMKEKVIDWEKQFWAAEVEKDLYKANLDTTFALYKPGYPQHFNTQSFLKALRIAGNFTAVHGGWYINPEQFTEENLHYIKSVGKSSTWKLDEQGKHDNKGQADYN